jgi:hypothetical protein
METMMDKLEDWVHHNIPSQGMARDVVDILVRRWGWTITLTDMAQFEEDLDEDMMRGDR